MRLIRVPTYQFLKPTFSNTSKSYIHTTGVLSSVTDIDRRIYFLSKPNPNEEVFTLQILFLCF
jgi:hypothetical protein